MTLLLPLLLPPLIHRRRRLRRQTDGRSPRSDEDVTAAAGMNTTGGGGPHRQPRRPRPREVVAPRGGWNGFDDGRGGTPGRGRDDCRRCDGGDRRRNHYRYHDDDDDDGRSSWRPERTTARDLRQEQGTNNPKRVPRDAIDRARGDRPKRPG